EHVTTHADGYIARSMRCIPGSFSPTHAEGSPLPRANSAGSLTARRVEYPRPMIRFAAVLIVALGGCITHAPSLVVSRPESQTDTAVTAMWSHDVHAVVQDGDWILTRSYTAVGDAITGVTAGDVSHSQIYDAQRDAVIEANGEGVHETKLDQVIA